MTGHGARGVVLPSNVARRDLSLQRTDIEDYWVPSEDDVGELEAALRDAVKTRLAEANREPPSADRDADVDALTQIQAHLSEYVRQYAGIVVNGNRRVLLNAFPDDTYCYRDQLIVVKDGGAWFWTIQYDVKLHQFLHWELASKAFSGATAAGSPLQGAPAKREPLPEMVGFKQPTSDVPARDIQAVRSARGPRRFGSFAAD